MRFRGVVGFGTSVEDPEDPSVWVDDITEKSFTGDVVRDTSKSQEGDGLNEDVVMQNQISIVANRHAIGNYSDMKYVEWEGERWTIDSVEVRPPRLILSLGEPYNGPTPS